MMVVSNVCSYQGVKAATHKFYITEID